MKRLLLLIILLAIYGRTKAQFDLKPVEVFPLEYAVPGNVSFNLTALNVGNALAPYFKVCWQVDNGPVSEANTTLTYPFGPNMTFAPKITGSFVANFPAAGLIPVKIWLRAVNNVTDANPANDTIIKYVKVMNNLPVKNVLMEVFKHQACCPCLPAAEYEAEFIDTMQRYSIANIYTGPTDVIMNPEGASVNGTYNLAHPAAVYDRFKFAYSTTIDRNWYTLDTSYLLEDIGERERYYEPVEVYIQSSTFNDATRELTVKLRAKFYDTLTGDYRFNLYLTEDSVKAWQGCATPDPYEYYHMHVVRAMVGGSWGAAGSLPATVYPGDIIDYDFSYTVPATYKLPNLKLIPLVQKYTTDPLDCKVLNTSKLSFDEAITLAVPGAQQQTNQFDIYPNPASRTLYIRSGSGNKGGATTLELLDMQGNLLQQREVKATEEVVDLSSLASGSYFIRLSNAKGTVLRKVLKSEL